MHPQSAIPNVPRALLHKFCEHVARMRFFTLSVILHGIVLVFAAGVIWYEQAPPEYDYRAYDGVTFDLAGALPPGDVLDEDTSTISDPPSDGIGLRFSGLEAARIAGPTGVFPLIPQISADLNYERVTYPQRAPSHYSRMTCCCLPVKLRNVVVVMDGFERRNGETAVSMEHAALERAATELIRQRSPYSLLGVVVYARTARAFGEKCEFLTDPERDRAIDWLTGPGPKEANGTPDSASGAALALEAAFALEPSEIYFFADTPPTPKAATECLRIVKRLEAQRATTIPIHTIASGPKAGHAFLKQLAEQTGGTFRVVDSESEK